MRKLLPPKKVETHADATPPATRYEQLLILKHSYNLDISNNDEIQDGTKLSCVRRFEETGELQRQEAADVENSSYQRYIDTTLSRGADIGQRERSLVRGAVRCRHRTADGLRQRVTTTCFE